MPESLVALRDRREQVIARISDGYAEDLLEVEELERRLDLAHNARTVAELDELVADLVGMKPTTALVPTQQQSLVVDDPTRPQTKRLRVIMSSVERRGRWTVPREIQLRVFWGNIELDFRDALLGPGVTTVHVSVTMGNVEVVVPPGLAVDVDVSSFMGNVEERHRVPPDPDPSRPILRIEGAVRLGNLEIETRLQGESRGDARWRERGERKRLRRERRALRRAERRALPPGSEG